MPRRDTLTTGAGTATLDMPRITITATGNTQPIAAGITDTTRSRIGVSTVGRIAGTSSPGMTRPKATATPDITDTIIGTPMPIIIVTAVHTAITTRITMATITTDITGIIARMADRMNLRMLIRIVRGITARTSTHDMAGTTATIVHTASTTAISLPTAGQMATVRMPPHMAGPAARTNSRIKGRRPDRIGQATHPWAEGLERQVLGTSPLADASQKLSGKSTSYSGSCLSYARK